MGSNYISFENEISSLSDYLRIEHLRFGDKFDYSLDVSEIENKSELEVCPGMVQPLIENAIWHGVRILENRKGLIKIRYIPGGDEGIKCIIEDDGVGRDSSVRNKDKTINHKPKGIGIVSERLQITGKLRRTIYNLEITDLYTDRIETGTRVKIDIPARIVKTRQL